jgi:hypothetical protein
MARTSVTTVPTATTERGTAGRQPVARSPCFRRQCRSINAGSTDRSRGLARTSSGVRCAVRRARNRRDLRVGELDAAELEARESRHHEVEQDQAWAEPGLQRAEGVTAVAGYRDVEARAFEEGRGRLADVGIVLDEKDGMPMRILLIHALPRVSLCRSATFEASGGPAESQDAESRLRAGVE